MTHVYQIIRQAMLSGSPVSLFYKGHTRLVCAHVLGTKNGLPQVLTYQYGGGSSSGLPNGGEWRCLMVGNISDVKIVEGPWRTDDNHSRAQTCVDQVDVEIWVADGKPYVKRA
jgi:hypothetical protein